MKKITLLPLLTLLLISCSFNSEKKNENDNMIKNTLNKLKIKKETKKIELDFTCTEVNIDDYVKDGWKVTDVTEKDVTCTWKSIKATPNCNLEKDKGCRITVPDKKGKKVNYVLIK